MTPPPKPTNPRRELWAHEYIVDYNATQAAIRAGYSARSAKTTGARLLADDNLMMYVDYLTGLKIRRLGYSADQYMMRLVEIERYDIRSAAPDELGHLDDVSGRVLQSVKVGDIKYTAADRLKALRMLRDHVSIRRDYEAEDASSAEAPPVEVTFVVSEAVGEVKITRGASDQDLSNNSAGN